MLPLQSRIKTTGTVPFRTKRPESAKIIFLSMEGCVTEEEYFRCVSAIFSDIETKIKFISVADEAARTPYKGRTPEQNDMLSRVRPKQLVERIDTFKEQNSDYQFEAYPEDEFWIVTDVDKNWSDEKVSPTENKTFKEEWGEAVAECREKGYSYAVSNPFFEIWLLLHHDQPSEKDKSFAVSDEHPYETTNHFRTRLSELGAPLRDKKHINSSNYSDEKIKIAIRRAEELHKDKEDLCPRYFATTVYLLLKKIVEMLPEETSSKDVT